MSDFIIENGVLKEYDGAGGDVVIPEGVTSIGKWTFSSCSSLTSIAIPDSVTSIGERAFESCPDDQLGDFDSFVDLTPDL